MQTLQRSEIQILEVKESDRAKMLCVFPSQLVNSYLALERNMIKYHKTKTKLITAVNQITKVKNSKEKQEKCISVVR